MYDEQFIKFKNMIVARLKKERKIKFIKSDNQEEAEMIKFKVPYFTESNVIKLFGGNEEEKKEVEVNQDIINAKFEDAVINYPDKTIDNLINYLKENGKTYYLINGKKFAYHPHVFFEDEQSIECVFYFAKKD